MQHVSQFAQVPKESHYKAELYVLRSLKADPTVGIFLSNKPDCSITAYCDSNWAIFPESRRFVISYIALLGNDLISWKSIKQSTISLYSGEVEYRAIRKAWEAGLQGNVIIGADISLCTANLCVL